MRFPKKELVILGASALLHTFAISSEARECVARPVRTTASVIVDRYERYSIEKERSELVEDARKDLAEGKLGLGEFLLKAEALDAKEEGRTVDAAKAIGVYEGYARDLFQATRIERKSIPEAVPVVFSDMEYLLGQKNMAEALTGKSGNCESLSNIIAAAVYDAGYGDLIFFRRYASNSKGIPHVAPILLLGGVEYDLTAGMQALKRADGDYAGIRSPAAGVVESYASSHGLGSQETPDDKRYVDLKGETDVYSDRVPLFSKKAINGFDGREQTAGAIDYNRSVTPSSFSFHKFENFRSYEPAFGYPGTERFLPVEAPTHEELEYLFDLIAQAEDEESKWTKEPATRMCHLANLARLCEDAEYGSMLLRKDGLAKAAGRIRSKAISSAHAIIDANPPGSDGLPLLRSMRRCIKSMTIGDLAHLGPKGQELLFSYFDNAIGNMTGHPVYEFWDAERFIGELIRMPSSRKRALELARRLPSEYQNRLFQGLFEHSGGNEFEDKDELLEEQKRLFSANQRLKAILSKEEYQDIDFKTGLGEVEKLIKAFGLEEKHALYLVDTFMRMDPLSNDRFSDYEVSRDYFDWFDKNVLLWKHGEQLFKGVPAEIRRKEIDEDMNEQRRVCEKVCHQRPAL